MQSAHWFICWIYRQVILSHRITVHHGLPRTNQPEWDVNQQSSLPSIGIPQTHHAEHLMILSPRYDMYYIFLAVLEPDLAQDMTTESVNHPPLIAKFRGLSCWSAYCRWSERWWKRSHHLAIEGTANLAFTHWQHQQGTSVVVTLLHPLPLQCVSKTLIFV